MPFYSQWFDVQTFLESENVIASVFAFTVAFHLTHLLV